MNAEDGKIIAALLVNTAQGLLSEFDAASLTRYPVTFRAGSGKATYFKASRVSGWSLSEVLIITIGAGMVIDKANSREHASRWRTGKEILSRGYWQGELTLQSVLVHTVMHEYAHYHQYIKGLRRPGSVHDDGFYQCLDALYASALPQQLMQALTEHLDFAQLSFANTDNDPVDVPTAVQGDEVLFTYKNQHLWARIVRVNRTRYTVRLACDSMMYVPKGQILAVR
jgi:hypothetical protein